MKTHFITNERDSNYLDFDYLDHTYVNYYVLENIIC